MLLTEGLADKTVLWTYPEYAAGGGEKTKPSFVTVVVYQLFLNKARRDTDCLAVSLYSS